MRVDTRTAKIETTSNDIAAELEQYGHTRNELTNKIDEPNRSHTEQLSVIEEEMRTCALETKGQRDALLGLQRMLKTYVVFLPTTCSRTFSTDIGTQRLVS
jgi:seryl-tRNA synthetase